MGECDATSGYDGDHTLTFPSDGCRALVGLTRRRPGVRTHGRRTGRTRAAEAELVAREKKRKQLDIVDLTPEARAEHAATWHTVQIDFVDDPQDAVGRAERLVTRVMRERGYPIDDFDHRAADISVDHPDIVENYRGAHAIYQSQHDGNISTEDARQAFVHYRALFDRLLGSDPEPQHVNDGQRRQSHDHA